MVGKKGESAAATERPLTFTHLNQLQHKAIVCFGSKVTQLIRSFQREFSAALILK